MKAPIRRAISILTQERSILFNPCAKTRAILASACPFRRASKRRLARAPAVSRRNT
jgi:hypothetical protein